MIFPYLDKASVLKGTKISLRNLNSFFSAVMEINNKRRRQRKVVLNICAYTIVTIFI